MEKIEGTLARVPTIFNKCPLFIYNKLNKLQIKLLWVFINYNNVLGSIKNKKFLNLSDPLTINDISYIGNNKNVNDLLISLY